jgi:hypothetical protein
MDDVISAGNGVSTGAEGSASVAETTPATSQTPSSTEGQATPAGQQTPGSTDQDPSLVGQAQAPVQPYTVNRKFKAAGQEKEFPEWLAAAITDQEKEKEIREVYSAFAGIDTIKEHRDRLIAENEAITTEWGPMVETVSQAAALYQKGDLHSAFQVLGIPEAAVLRYAVERVKYSRLPDDQKKQIDSHQDAVKRAADLEKQVQEYQQRYESVAIAARETELSSQLSRPEIQSVAASFDARAGKPGAFRAEVIKRGKFYAAQGIDVPTQQAVEEVLMLVGGVPSQPSAPLAGTNGATANPATAGTVAAASEPAKPTLPNVKGRGTSPVKQQIRSTDDLRKLARSFS